MRRLASDITQPLKPVSLVMVREHLESIPEASPPEGYRVRLFRQGEQGVWAQVEAAVGEFPDTEAALRHFDTEFGPHIGEMEQRCLFLEASDGHVVGTTTAWFNEGFRGERYGRIHWVAVTPPYQGRGLGKALLSAALRLLRDWHEKAYLTTQTTSWIAIHLYLDFGFVPFVTDPAQEEGWDLLRSLRPHPLLDRGKIRP